MEIIVSWEDCKYFGFMTPTLPDLWLALAINRKCRHSHKWMMIVPRMAMQTNDILTNKTLLVVRVLY